MHCAADCDFVYLFGREGCSITLSSVHFVNRVRKPLQQLYSLSVVCDVEMMGEQGICKLLWWWWVWMKR